MATLRKLPQRAWEKLASWPAWLLLVLMLGGYALWDARAPVTMIAPFQLGKADLPFTGDIVADSVGDGLKTIRNEIAHDRQEAGLKSSDSGLEDLRNVAIPHLLQVQAPPRFSVEVKGISYERILSVARAILGTETTITGDVVLTDEKKIVLIARTADAGPWMSEAAPITAQGLQQASQDLAVKIIKSLDPTLAGVALLRAGQINEGLNLLNRARTLNPSDIRLKLNLCAGFAASRHYDEAIECYNDALKAKPDLPLEVQEHLAHTYYLSGMREDAIKIYKKLAYTEGDRDALLGLGEAVDYDGNHQLALDIYDEFLATERRDPNRAIAHVKRGLALEHLKRWDEALNEYEDALKYAPRDVLIRVHEALEQAKSTDAKDAGIAQLRSVVEENQSSDAVPFAYLELGTLLEKTGDWRGAIEEYRKAAQLRPGYVEARRELAEALTHEGDRENAFDQYNELARLSPKDLERGYAEVFAKQWLANKLRDFGNYRAAASAYREVIRVKSDNSAAHCQLALILARQGQLSQAVREYGEASVPAKLEAFNDKGCLAVVDQMLEQAVASGKSRHTFEVAAELHKLKEKTGTGGQSVSAENLSPSSDKGRVVEQAVLRKGQ